MITASEVQETLRDLITQYGPPNQSNSKMYSAVLKSALANDPREAGLLQLSLDKLIPGKLFAQKNNPQIIDQLVQELISSHRIDNHASEWIVKTWAKAMGMNVPAYQPPVQKQYQQQTPIPQPQSTQYSGNSGLVNPGGYQQPPMPQPPSYSPPPTQPEIPQNQRAPGGFPENNNPGQGYGGYQNQNAPPVNHPNSSSYKTPDFIPPLSQNSGTKFGDIGGGARGPAPSGISLASDENVIWQGRASIKAWLPWILICTVFTIITVGIGLILLIPITLIGLVQYYVSEYVITNKRIFIKGGVIWRDSTEGGIDTLIDTSFDQGFFGRMLNFGNVEFNNAASTGKRQVMVNVDNPTHIVSIARSVKERRARIVDVQKRLDQLKDRYYTGELSNEQYQNAYNRIMRDEGLV